MEISGTPGSGKSTVAKELARELGFKHYSAGDFMRQMAKERGVSLLELSKRAEKDKSIDKEIDRRTQKLAEEEDDFVIDSRLAFHFIPRAFKVFLKVDSDVAAQRIYKDIEENKREQEREFASQEHVRKGIEKRMASEKQRYEEYYGIDFLKESHYDLVLDTEGKTIEECAQIIRAALPQ